MFVSYSQNHEDALLWRALGTVDAGFFIDVGAGDPVAESVTKAFSLAGWTGINIDPSPVAFAMLQQDRPRDVNLCLAAGSTVGTFEYHAVDGGNGLSTGVDDYASRYLQMDWPVDTFTVPMRTLADICDEYAPATIHFLKIDVEGSEREVLLGADFDRHRPWVVMVEAVQPAVLVSPEGEPRAEPSTAITTHHEWEELLVAAGYRFVVFDGLNRVYVAEEQHDRLGPLLAAPVSVLDRVQRADLLEERRRSAEERDALRGCLDDAARRGDEALEALHRTQHELEHQVDTVARLQSELDHCHQELYVGSRALASSAAQVQAAEQRAGQLAQQLAQQGDELHMALGQAEHGRAVERELQAVYASKAWRITKPLRAVRSVVARAFRRSR